VASAPRGATLTKPEARGTTKKRSSRKPPKLRLVEQEELDALDLKTVQDFADKLPDTYLDCRSMQHRWTGHTAGRHEMGGYHVVLRCTRCTTRKHQDLNDRGMVLRTWYTYPDGYLTEGVGRLIGEARGVLRLTSVLRTITKIESRK
jgi:hypothetical protein